MVQTNNNNQYLEHQTCPGPTCIIATNSLNAYTDNKDSMHNPHTHLTAMGQNNNFYPMIVHRQHQFTANGPHHKHATLTRIKSSKGIPWQLSAQVTLTSSSAPWSHGLFFCGHPLSLTSLTLKIWTSKT